MTVAIILRFSWCLESDTFKKQEDKKDFRICGCVKGIWIAKLLIFLSALSIAVALIYLEVHDTTDKLSNTMKGYVQVQLHLCDTLIIFFFLIWIKLKVVAAEEYWSTRKKINSKVKNILNGKFLAQCILSVSTLGVLTAVILLFQESSNDLTKVDAREAIQKVQFLRY